MIVQMQDVKFNEITQERFDAMISWSREHFGRNALWQQQVDSGNSRWFAAVNIPRNEETGRARFVFKNNEDTTMFALRWSS